MFTRLDEDGGGTLDCGEITALFRENGISMTIEQVANMFGEADRANATQKNRRFVQKGDFDKVDTRTVGKRSVEQYLKM